MSAIEDLELSIKEHKKSIARGATLKRLFLNRDFQDIIMKGYLEDEAIRLVHRKSAYSTQNPVDQDAINKRIDAIGILKHYMDAIIFSHDQAIKELEMDSATLQDMLTGDSNQ